MDISSLLHNSCKLYHDTLGIVESAYHMDPDAIRRPVPIDCNPSNQYKKGEDEVKKFSILKRTPVDHKYSYPINIALKCKASTEVIQFLIKMGPDVLDKPDGPNRTSSLSIAITLKYDDKIIKSILKANKKAARTLDRRSNTALHVLVQSTSTKLCTYEVVRLIYNAYPEAVSKRNFHRETPLDIAARSELCPEEVVNFFHSRAFGKLDAENLSQLDDLAEEELDNLAEVAL